MSGGASSPRLLRPAPPPMNSYWTVLTLRCDPTMAGYVLVNGIDHLRALPDQKVSCMRTRVDVWCSSVLTGTNRMLGRSAASQIDLASAASFFWRFT